jgi:hypothetical protein
MPQLRWRTRPAPAPPGEQAREVPRVHHARAQTRTLRELMSMNAPALDRHVNTFAGQDIRTLISHRAATRAAHQYLELRAILAREGVAGNAGEPIGPR